MKKLCLILITLLINCICLCVSAENTIFAFEEKSYTLLVGKTLKVKAIAQGIDGKLIYEWTSSDESIATVKSGKVTGISDGVVIVTCAATDIEGSTHIASCTIRVNIPIKKITANVQSITLGEAPRSIMDDITKYTSELSLVAAGYTQSEAEKIHSGAIKLKQPDLSYCRFKPIITIEPENATVQDLEWSSSNPSVVSVSKDGLITGHRYGKTTVIGKATDGSGQRVKINVNVPLCYTTADSITISEESGATLGYVCATISGILNYDIKTKGNCFSYKHNERPDSYKSQYYNIDYITLIPRNIGSGSISFILNGDIIKTVKVKVEKTAVRNKSTYPTLDINDAIQNQDKYIGRKVSIEGSFVTYLNGLIISHTNSKTRSYYGFEYNLNDKLLSGDTVVTYGTVDKFITFTTETGLLYEIPYLVDVMLK